MAQRGRPPHGAVARDEVVSLRFSNDERLRLDEQRVARGAPTASAYIRRLLADDARKIRRERPEK